MSVYYTCLNSMISQSKILPSPSPPRNDYTEFLWPVPPLRFLLHIVGSLADRIERGRMDYQQGGLHGVAQLD
jgi:hypothetical protein